MKKGAVLSEDNKYRYSLWRIWDDTKDNVCFVGLNPSTADDQIDDPTIKKCINFTKKWGYGGFYMINLFAFRATDPEIMLAQKDPIGEDNNSYIKEIITKVDKVICVWGNKGTLNNRNKEVLGLIEKPYCLQMNKSGEPAHPLYLKKSLEPILLDK